MAVVEKFAGSINISINKVGIHKGNIDLLKITSSLFILDKYLET